MVTARVRCPKYSLLISDPVVFLATYQRILCLLTLMYNSGKARSGAQGRQFNGDTFFSSLATTVQGLVAASSTNKAWLLNSMSCTAPVHPRTLEELRDAGYSPVHRVGDPFSPEHAASVNACMERLDRGTSIALDMQPTHIYRLLDL